VGGPPLTNHTIRCLYACTGPRLRQMLELANASGSYRFLLFLFDILEFQKLLHRVTAFAHIACMKPYPAIAVGYGAKARDTTAMECAPLNTKL
jgi:hypothetical protein